MAYEAQVGGSRPGEAPPRAATAAAGPAPRPTVTSPGGPATRPTMTTPPAAAAGSSGSPAPEWAVQALDKVDDIVDKVRSNTTDRLVRIARVVVFGLLALIMGATAGVLAVIGLVRGLDELLPGPVWGVYVLLGAIFTGAGAFLWSKKTARPAGA
ncbi:MAG: hypothetical protein V7605_666 [Acidimicrobiaceae bacterium]|jgi:hypothetical protein